MIVTVLWEDQRGTETKGFGPHELLIACLTDELTITRERLVGLLKCHPKKGNGNVRAALQRDLDRLSKSGPVVAVVDRDKIRDLWKPSGEQPPDCIAGIASRFRSDAPGDYELVLLVDNVEDLVRAACTARRVDVPTAKPTPDERDRILARCAWDLPHARSDLRNSMPSFDRLVKQVAQALRRSSDNIF
jgi:hypothetical protein